MHLITVSTDEPRTESLSEPDNMKETTGERSENTENGGTGAPEREVISKPSELCDKDINDPLVSLVRNFVDMSRRMLEAISGRSDVPKTAQQFHVEYVERVAQQNANNIRMILKWKSEVDERLDRIEKSCAIPPKSFRPFRRNDDDDVSSDNGNEPPYNAVSQGRNKGCKTRPNNDNVTKCDDKGNKGARKLFPARAIHETPNPRLAQKGPSAAKGGRVKPTSEAMNISEHSFEDANPYGPLSDESIIEQIEQNEIIVRKSPSFGRGRGRKKGNMIKPGAATRSAPAKQTKTAERSRPSGPTKPPPRVAVTRPATKPVADVSSSWYDEEEEDAELSMASAVGQADNSEWETGLEDSPTNEPRRMVRQDIASTDLGQPSIKPGGDKGRKHTSTKEAPVEPQQDASSKGKSTAPLNKKTKVDSSNTQGDKISYAGTLKKNQWDTAKGKNKSRSRLGNKRIPELKSAAEASLMEIYIQELDCSNCRGAVEFEEMVLEYCKRRGLNAVDACTIPVKNSRTKSGCKLTVHEVDYDSAMCRDFWPRGSSVRPWRSRPRNDSNEEDDRSSSE